MADVRAVFERVRDGFRLSTDPGLVPVAEVHRFLSEDAYWSAGLKREALERALAGSLPIVILAPDGDFAGFGRVVTDYALFAYLRDVFVAPAYRGRGLASWAAAAIREHPDLRTVTTWMLATRDAHGVYEKAGFRPVPHPEYYMSLPKPDGSPAPEE